MLCFEWKPHDNYYTAAPRRLHSRNSFSLSLAVALACWCSRSPSSIDHVLGPCARRPLRGHNKHPGERRTEGDREPLFGALESRCSCRLAVLMCRASCVCDRPLICVLISDQAIKTLRNRSRSSSQQRKTRHRPSLRPPLASQIRNRTATFARTNVRRRPSIHPASARHR